MGISAIDNALRRGLGFGAKALGTNFEVYRIGGANGGPNAAPHVIHPSNMVFDNFQARITLNAPKFVVEQEKNIYPMVYTGLCDTRQLKIGDILVETGPDMVDTPDGRMYVLSSVQPMLPPVFIRAEVAATVTRPWGDGPDDEPPIGKIEYQGESKFTEQHCVLENGLYDFGHSGIPTVIPFGLQPYRRFGSSQEFHYATATKRSVLYGFCPLLPGTQLQPGDYISDHNGNRAIIQTCSSFTTGLQGWLLQLETVFT